MDRSQRLGVTILTALPCETDAVLRHIESARPEARGESIVYVGELNGSEGECIVTVIEVGPGNIKTAAEAGRIEGRGSTDILLFVGIAGALKDLRLGDVVAASEVAYIHRAKVESGERLARQQLNRCSELLVRVARHTAREDVWQRLRHPASEGPAPKAYVGQILSGEELVKDANYKQRLKRDHSDALAIENEGFGLSSVAGPTLRVLVIRGASDNSDESKSDLDQPAAADAAAAFTAQFLRDYIDIVRAPTLEVGDGQRNRGHTGTTPGLISVVDAVEQIMTDPDLIDDTEEEASELADAEFARLDNEERVAWCRLLASALNDESKLNGFFQRRMIRFSKRFAARAVNEKLAVNWDELLVETPNGAALMLAQPDQLGSLPQRVRRRVVSALVGPAENPRPMTLSGAVSVAGLLSSDALTNEERSRVELSEDLTPYIVLREGAWGWPLLFRKLSRDLASGDFERQNTAVRFLLRSDSPHLQTGNFDLDQQRTLVRLIIGAARGGAYGAQNATTVSQMSRWPAPLLAEALWCDLTAGRRRLDAPRTEIRTVLSAALLSGSLECVIDCLLESGRGQELDPINEDSVTEDRDWLVGFASKLPSEAKIEWSRFVDALYERIPRK